MANDTNMQAEPLSDATADIDNLGMQTDDELFLQINLRPDEVDQLNKLYEEAMEEPVIEWGKVKKVLGNKIGLRVILEQCDNRST